jgi:Bacterial Ig-like domain (group 3)/Beta-propeller repeat
MTLQHPCNPAPMPTRSRDNASTLQSLFVFSLMLCCTAFAAAQQPKTAHQVRDFGKIPLSFEPNRGQTEAGIQFLSRGQGYALYLNAGTAVLQLQKPTPAPSKGSTAPAKVETSTLAMKLVGARQDATADAQDLLPGTVNYFVGNDPAKWQKALPTYKRVAFRGVYPGVDLVYYGNQRQLEYDFVVAPGADVAKIALQFTGTTPVIDKAGDLVLAMQGEEARFHKPVVYQLDGDRKVSVAGSYQIADGKVSFSLGAYDHSKALVIDPILSYLTYLGGSMLDQANGIAVDSSGSVYVVGTTYSTDFPVKNAYQATDPHTIPSAPGAMFVTKFNPTGTALVYSTYLGSTEYTYGNGIAVDASGNAYAAGYTTYGTYPITAGAFQTICGAQYSPNGPTVMRVNGCVGAGQGDEGGVLTKLNPTGTALVYSTYYSGDNGNVINAVAVDASGQAYVTGLTTSFNYSGAYGNQCLPTTAGAVQTCETSSTGGGTRVFGFLAKFDAAGANLLYGSLLGPTTAAQSTTTGYAVAVDAAGFAYIGGSTYNNLYVTTGAYQTTATTANGDHAFAAKFDTVGKKIVYSTYLTGTDTTSNVGEAVTSIAADASGNAYVAGYTAECSFPTTSGVFEPQASYPAGTATSCGAGFITKLNATGSALVWSTFLGNAPAGNGLNSGGNASINGMTLGTDGSVYVAGQTNGGGFPSVNPIFGVAGNFGFISRVSADGTKLLFSTPFGSSTGNSTDVPYGVAVDASGNIYFAGQTNANLLPVTPGAFQPAHAHQPNSGYYNTGFVGKIAPFATTTTALTLPTGTITAGQSVKLSAKVTGQTGSTGTPTGIVTFLSGSTTLGTGTLDSTGTATFTTAALSATTYSLTASYPGDTAFSGSVSAAQNLVVNPLTATVSLNAPATAVVGASVTLATTVSGTGGTPTGTVTFKNGTTIIGTATLASGTASISTSSLALGAHSITVAYSGDMAYASATSAASTVTINAAASISFAAAPTSLTITHGTSGSVVITGTPLGSYTGTVTFACGTLPTAATCSFAPTTLSFTGSNTAQSTTLTVSTITTAALERPSFGKASSGLVLAALLMPFGWMLRRRKQVWRSSLLLLALVCSSLAVFGLSGCGGSSGTTKTPTTVTTPAGSYTVAVTVTATGGNSALNIPLTVQ